ncbi:MAG: Fe-S protein assembly co-chaperone HscB [Gammaproteobacteria bacterium]|nr:Fe-S protein assembly co-chaperone HscB [Gammaproteobacteria bacterium]
MSDLFSKNYFEIFELPVGFELDLAQLSAVYRELQKEIHPDRFVSAGDQQSRLAVQMASLVNQAYDTLKSPVSRAHYLLKLGGLDIDHEQDTTMDPMFLMEQIELREEIESLRLQSDALAETDRLLSRVKGLMAAVMNDFAQAYQQQLFDKAHELSRKMQFLNKNIQELNDIAVAIEDELLG